MHRSRLSVFVIAAAVAACSTGDASETAGLLSQDSTLVARLEKDATPRQQAVAYACSAIKVAAPTAGVDTPESAPSLTTQCKNAAPTVAATEARQRATKSSQPERRVASGITGAATRERAAEMTARHVASAEGTVESEVVGSVPDEQVVPAMSDSSSAAGNGTADAPSPTSPVAASPNIAGSGNGNGNGNGTAGSGEAVATTDRAPAAEQASTTSRQESRTQSRSQRAGIGALAGAIFGAVSGRSVKGAVIGAATGGVLGSVMGGGIRPARRTVRP